MLSYKNKKRLEDMLTDEIIKAFTGGKPYSFEGLKIAVDLLKEFLRYPYKYEEDDNKKDTPAAKNKEKLTYEQLHAALDNLRSKDFF